MRGESPFAEHPIRAAVGARLVANTVAVGQLGHTRANPAEQLEVVRTQFVYCAACRTWLHQRARWTGVSWRWRCAACGAHQEAPRTPAASASARAAGAREEDDGSFVGGGD